MRTPIAVLGWSYNAVLLYVSESARYELGRKTRIDARCQARLDALGAVLLSGLLFIFYLGKSVCVRERKERERVIVIAKQGSFIQWRSSFISASFVHCARAFMC